MGLKLFQELLRGELFHYGDRPDRLMIKADDYRQVTPEGHAVKVHPHVAVVSEEGTTKDYRSFYGKDSTTGKR